MIQWYNDLTKKWIDIDSTLAYQILRDTIASIAFNEEKIVEHLRLLSKKKKPYRLKRTQHKNNKK